MNRTTTLFVGAATLLGLTIGVGTATVQMSSVPWPGDVTYGPNPELPDVTAGIAAVVVDNTHHDFGSMDVDEVGRHDFVFTNKGTASLMLSSGDTSCQCTVAKIKQPQIRPGEATIVRLTWTADEYLGDFRQTAKIRTNDPDNPMIELTVSGRIKAAVHAVPRQVEFPRLAVGETSSAVAMLYCTLDEPLEIGDFKLSDQDIAEFFEVEFQPLDAERLAEQRDAKSGYSLKVTVKPGLPLGPFKQTILIATNLEAYPAVVVPITGTLASDILIAGRGWNRDAGVLVLGTVKSSEGFKRRLQLIVRGPHRKQVKFTPVATEPESLNITIGETKAVGEGSVTQTPILIEIPKSAPPCAFLGTERDKYGEILLQTNHPITPQFRIPVKLAIENQ